MQGAGPVPDTMLSSSSLCSAGERAGQGSPRTPRAAECSVLLITGPVILPPLLCPTRGLFLPLPLPRVLQMGVQPSTWLTTLPAAASKSIFLAPCLLSSRSGLSPCVLLYGFPCCSYCWIKTSIRCPQRSGHLPSAHTPLQVTGKDLVHPACKPLSWCPEQCKYGTEQEVQVPLGPPLPAGSVSSGGVCLALRVEDFTSWEFTASCDLAVCDLAVFLGFLFLHFS